VELEAMQRPSKREKAIVKNKRFSGNMNLASSLLSREVQGGGHHDRPRKRPRFSKVPDRLRVSLPSILDQDQSIKNSVILCFSVCGNFLIAYRRHEGSSRVRYVLEWWLFSFHKPLIRVHEVALFTGLEDSSSDVRSALSPEGSHLCIEIAQSADSASMAVLGYSSEESSDESRVNLLTLLPVQCIVLKSRTSCNGEENKTEYVALNISFVSYKPHDILGKYAILQGGENGGYYILLNTLTGIHSLHYSVLEGKSKCRCSGRGHVFNNNDHNLEETLDEDPTTSARSANRVQFSTSSTRSCFTHGFSWPMKAFYSLHSADATKNPITFRFHGQNYATTPSVRNFDAGICLLSSSSVDLERHLLHQIRQKSQNLPAPQSISIHNYSLKLVSAGTTVIRQSASIQQQQQQQQYKPSPPMQRRETSGNDGDWPVEHKVPLAQHRNNLRISCALVLELSWKKSPNEAPKISCHPFHLGIDWVSQTIKDLKMRKPVFSALVKKRPDVKRISVCSLVAIREKVQGWYFHGRSSIDGTPFHSLLATNAAVFRGASMQYIRHPHLPIVLLFN